MSYNGLEENLVPSSYFEQGGLWVAGFNSNNELGIGNTTNQSSPVQTIAGGTNWKQVSHGLSHMAAIKTDGTLWTWGFNNRGQLGTNNTTSQSSPVQTVSGGSNWKQMDSSRSFVAAIKTDGTLWMFGENSNYQLGDTTTAHKSSPIQTVAGGTNWKLVSAGSYHTAAIKTDGTLWTWGNNSYGQLGDNTLTIASSPIQTVAGGTNWKQISAGYRHMAAIKSDGTLWLWGQNNYGQMGDNTVTSKSSPIQTVAGGTDWKQVITSTSFSGAIKTDGTLWTWGYNLYGQLGDNTGGTGTHKSSPIQTVAGGTNWKMISHHAQTTQAIKTDGTRWTWGYNGTGELGDNTIVHKSSPIQTVAGGTNWKYVGRKGAINQTWGTIT